MRFQFGGHVVDTGRRELHRDGAPIALEPQVFDLLVHLMLNRGRVVSKDDLIASVWGGRIVSDAAIDSRVRAARQAVGDSGAAQAVIRTIPRKGLRFVAEVREDREPAPAPEVQSLPDRPSIAVLPFTNMSGDPEQEYFADGITEDIITALSKWRWFFVIARNSTFVYKGRDVDVIQTGRELGVRHILEGSVRKIGNRVRVTAQLIDAVTGAHIWADRYDHELEDVFAVQDEVTRNVAGALAPALERNESERARRIAAPQLAAWDHCLRGMWHFHRYTGPEAIKALACFEQALAADTNFAEAYVWIARVQLYFATDRHGGAWSVPLAAALDAGRRALMIDRENALAHYVMALCAAYTGESETAGQHADRAVALNPNLAVGHAARGIAATHAGRHDDALAALDAALSLSPGDPQAFIWFSYRSASLYFLGDYRASVESSRRGSSLRWHNPGCRALAASLAQLGVPDGAAAALTEMLAQASGDKTITQAVASFVRPADRDHLAEGLRKAGLPA